MSTHDPKMARRRLRAALRDARETRGLTQRQTAENLDWSMSKVVRIEAGTVGVSTTDLLALIHLFGIDDAERGGLISLARAARKRPWYAQYQAVLSPAFEQYLGFEASATTICAFHPLLVPGLLQTEDYARSVLEAGGATLIDQRLELRRRRQEHLERPDRPVLHYIVDEGAVRRCVGGAWVMRAQLAHLKTAVTDPKTVFQVVPFAVGAHASMDESFTVLAFSGDGDEALYREAALGSVTDRDDQRTVDRYRERFSALVGTALTPEETSALIDRISKEL